MPPDLVREVPVSSSRATSSNGRLFKSALRASFSFPVFLSFSLIALTVLTTRNRFNDNDLWWHLKIGQVVWTTHSVPVTEIFSYTAPGLPWFPHEWLAQLSMYAAYRWWGHCGLMLWLDVFAALLLVSLYLLCWLYSGNAKVSLLGGLTGWFFGTVGLAMRPLVVGHLLLVMELLLLELGRKRDRRWFWGLPPLFAVWVNCHSSWPFGILILLVMLACSFGDGRIGPLVRTAWPPAARRTLIAALCASGVALFCNPVGWRLVPYPLNVLFLQPNNAANIQEWLPLPLVGVRPAGLLLILSGMALAAAARVRQIRLEEAVLCSLAAAMAIRHQRMLFLFGIIVAPVICRLLADCWERYDPDRDLRGMNGFCMALAVAVVVVAFPGQAHLAAQERAANPVAAVDYIRKARLSGPMLNSYDFGGYLMWTLPEHPVFIYGSADVFEWTGVLAAFQRWSLLQEDPQILLKKYHIAFCVLRSDSAIAYVIPYLPGWHKAFGDSVGSVFVHQE